MTEPNDAYVTIPTTIAVRPYAGKADFSMTMPGSKSIANRVLLLAAMAEGESVLSGLPDSDDARAALSALSALGIRTERLGPDAVRVHGCGHDIPNRRGEVDIRSAGTVGRFLPGMLASAGSGEWTLVSTPQLARRPLLPLVDGLRAWGADLAPTVEGLSFPLKIRGAVLCGGEVDVSARSSSQFASGLLLCAPFCAADAVVAIRDLDPRERYIAVTTGIMRHFGVETAVAGIPEGGVAVTVKAPAAYRAADTQIEADLNSALIFLVLPLLVGGRAAVPNAVAASDQPGSRFLDVIARLGGTVETGPGGVAVSASGGRLRGGFDIDMRAVSEMALALAVLAVFADAPITMTNLAHIRNHETDRLPAIAAVLGEAGVATEEGADWVRIIPAERAALKNVVIDSRDDHRVVMALALLGLAGNGVAIANADAVAKTFPDFFTRLEAVGAVVDEQ